MNIVDYIITGGEDLNSPAKKTPTFPLAAERVFTQWYTKLGKDDSEKENYLELPVDNATRIYIKQFWIEKNGHRPICYYVGFLLPRKLYIEAREYYFLNKGLSRVGLMSIQNAIKTLSPIAFSAEMPLPQKAIWTPLSELSILRLYGEREFDGNINRMCFSISINNIDDWFTDLLIAVNPYRMNESYTIVISRDEPRPEIKATTTAFKGKDIFPGDAQPQTRATPAFKKNNDSLEPTSSKRRMLHDCFLIVLFASLLLNVTFFTLWHFSQRNSISQENYNKLQYEKINAEETVRKLQKACEELSEKERKLIREEQELKSQNDDLRKKLKKLEEQCPKPSPPAIEDDKN